jgi:hypothetical protein
MMQSNGEPRGPLGREEGPDWTAGWLQVYAMIAGLETTLPLFMNNPGATDDCWEFMRAAAPLVGVNLGHPEVVAALEDIGRKLGG